MKIISFHSFDDINVRVFTIIRYLHGRFPEYVPNAMIRSGVRIAWAESPDNAPGKKRFDEALAQAQEDGLIVAERGRDGGYTLTQKGKERFEAELAARKYVSAAIIRRRFRAYLWPERIVASALGIAA